MNHIIASLLLLLAATGTFSQQLISSYGGSYANGDIAMSYSVGEVVIASFENENLLFTQGFHQPLMAFSPDTSTGINPRSIAGTLEYSLYPNPSSGIFNLEMQGFSDPVRVEIYHISGRLVFNSPPARHETLRIDLRGEARGMYILRLSAREKQYTEKLMLK